MPLMYFFAVVLYFHYEGTHAYCIYFYDNGATIVMIVARLLRRTF